MKLPGIVSLLLCVSLITSCGTHKSASPISLHPKNPHYFLFRSKPVVLIGSTEHYGAVMNLDFDFIKYLNKLAESGLNVTRTFTGAYVEPAGAFGIVDNTLAPAPGMFICPWARSTEPGYAGGGNKFDLSEWDESYFQRLKAFLTEAGERNIIVELDLFSNYYDTVQWKLSPLNSINNVNRVGDFRDHKEVLSLRHPELLDVQENMVRKIIHELSGFDNLYYEICNEPYFGDTIALREWEDRMTGVVVESEKDLKFRHLISNNVANNHKLVPARRNGVSIYNFHYARPPVTVDMNYNLNCVIGDNETGFDGIEDSKYRSEAWNFIMAGGGLFNNLDYSFTTSAEDGSATVGPGQPGGGGNNLRDQLKILAGFINSLDFISMKPLSEGSVIVSGQPGTTVRGLAKDDDVIALYLHRDDLSAQPSDIEMSLPVGSYKLRWTDTRKGTQIAATIQQHKGGNIKITSPAYSEDIALKIEKAK
jgi:hypothetical protein